MQLVVAGSRTFAPSWKDGVLVSGWTQAMMDSVLTSALESLQMDVDTVIHGAARGVDQMAGVWATGLGFSVDAHPADWNRLGKRAGYVRNAEMVNIADCAIIVWDRVSKGARHTIRLSHDMGLPYVVIARDPVPLVGYGA